MYGTDGPTSFEPSPVEKGRGLGPQGPQKCKILDLALTKEVKSYRLDIAQADRPPYGATFGTRPEF